ncbi:uncharacterized protein CBL_08020 [Carabus blaptoides fortunei]
MRTIRYFAFTVIVCVCLFCDTRAQTSDNSVIQNEVVNVTDIRVSVNRTPKPVAAKLRLISAGEQLVCPGNETGVPLFTLPCERNKDCAVLGPGLLCCQRKNVLFKRCLKGIPAPKPEPVHSPWLRIFPRKCPTTPIAEYREIKTCTTDDECAPRVCCPEPRGGENYCRTADIEFDSFPTVKRMLEPITSLAGFVQCTAGPSAILDLFPKVCNSMLDCFPNLCCQEQGRKICRPPRQSVLSLFAGTARRIASLSTQRTSSSNNNVNTNSNNNN